MTAASAARTGPPVRSRSQIATIAAFAALVFAPLLPAVLEGGTAAALLALPVESIVTVLILVIVPWRPLRWVVAGTFGIAVVAATLLAALDLGFEATIDRPVNLLTDGSGLVSAFGVVADAVGMVNASLLVVILVALLVAGTFALAACALRVAAVIVAAGRGGCTVAAAVTAAWMGCALVGAQLVPDVPFAASATAGALATKSSQIVVAVGDRQAFQRALRSDAALEIPPADLLSALKGKDVVIAFLESYGKVAVQGSTFSPGVDQALREGGAQLRADGYAARSAFLTSPTFGGVSWLAHSTLQSGLWVDAQQSYDELTASRRVTLTRAFAEAGWRTVAIVPSNDEDWPVGRSFYGYDTVGDARTMGYRGPRFSYARMPDQYTWKYFYDTELASPHAPVMAEIDFVSSHTPWTPLPHMVPWEQVGDGSVFDPQPAQGQTAVQVWADPRDVQRLYGESVQYTLEAMFSFLHVHDDPNLVLVVLGDHQPARIVSGPQADHDVPISIIAKDPAVMAAIASWRWDAGIRPSRDAPVWRMDAFRDRFLDAFSG